MGVRGEEVSALRMRPEGPISKGCSHPPLPRVQLDGTGQERSGPGRRLAPLVLLPLFVEVSEAIPGSRRQGPTSPSPPPGTQKMRLHLVCCGFGIHFPSS